MLRCGPPICLPLVIVDSVLRNSEIDPFPDETDACSMNPLDDDVDALERSALIAEVKRLRAAIREHRDSSGHELCWHHPNLWALLPEKTDPLPAVPEWPQFLRGCIRYRESLDGQLPSAPRTDEEFSEER